MSRTIPVALVIAATMASPALAEPPTHPRGQRTVSEEIKRQLLGL